MNGAGLLADRFGSSDTVFVSGSAVGGVGLIPAVDIYVTKNVDWSGKDGTSLAGLDVTNPTHTQNTAVGLEVVDLPIWLPTLATGQYDVVIDKNQDGHFDGGFDEVLGLARSDAAAAALEAKGATAHRGSLDDLDSLAAGAASADAVIHLAFKHDFSDYAAAGRSEHAAVARMLDTLEG
jgi:hypothetical protein